MGQHSPRGPWGLWWDTLAELLKPGRHCWVGVHRVCGEGLTFAEGTTLLPQSRMQREHDRTNGKKDTKGL